MYHKWEMLKPEIWQKCLEYLNGLLERKGKKERKKKER